VIFEELEKRALLSAYYVSQSGDDALNDGSAAAPFASIAKVNSLSLQPGDSVFFNGGETFTGTLAFDAADGGSAASPVVIRSYGDGRATIAAGNANGISARNTGGFRISDLNVVGAGQAANTFNGIAFDNALGGNVKLGYVHIDHVDVSGFGKYGITVGGSNGKSGFADVRVEYVNVHHNALGGIETHGVFSSTATGYANADVYVGHAEVHHNPGYAGSPNHSGDGIVLSDADGVTIERSEAYENGAANTHVGGPVGIWVWDVNGAVIQHNESHHNKTAGTADGGGFDFDGGVTNSVMQYNYSHDNFGPGYGVYQFQGARPLNNLTVRYNVSANDARRNDYGAIDFWNGNGSNGIKNVAVYNNTVYVTPSAVTTTTTTTRKGQTTTTTTTTATAPKALRFISGTTNVSIRNNVFQTTGGVQLADVQATQTNLQIQGNDYWSSGAAFSLKVFAKTYASFSAYVNGTPYEKVGATVVGRNVDPLLANPASVPTVGVANIDALETSLDGFKLTAPLAGLNLFSQFGIDPGPRDFFGDPVTGAGTDIGAYEFA
jgi:hypothetical protein